MNRFYGSVVVLAAVVAVGLRAAGWLYETYDARTAFYLDAFAIVLPFFLVSLYVLRQSLHAIRHRRLAPRPLAIAVVAVIFVLYAITVRNLWVAYGSI